MSNMQKLEWALKIGVAGEFTGHGLLATGFFDGGKPKADWVGWMMRFTHLSHDTAATFVMIVGITDVVVALVVLVKPINWVLLWATFWGFWTALIRPLMGVGWLDFIERFANFGAPLALYYLYKINKK